VPKRDDRRNERVETKPGASPHGAGVRKDDRLAGILQTRDTDVVEHVPGEKAAAAGLPPRHVRDRGPRARRTSRDSIRLGAHPHSRFAVPGLKHLEA